MGLEGEYLFREVRVWPDDVDTVELYGCEAAPEGIYHPGGGRLRSQFRDQHDTGEGIAEGLREPGASGLASEPGSFAGGLRLVVSRGGMGR